MRRSARWALRAGGLALPALVVLGAGSASAAFLATAEKSPLLIVATVGAPARIDPHAYRAPLHVHRRVAGELNDDQVIVAWEELAPSRPPRLVEGRRVLIALEPLPSSSLWRQRFGGEQRPVRVIADQSNGYLALPPAPAIDALAAYLALPAERRSEAEGIAALVNLAKVDSPMAIEAVERLGQLPNLAGAIDKKSTDSLASLLQSGKRPRALRLAVIALAGQARLMALKPALEKLARPGGELEAPALSALAVLDGGFAPERAAALLQRKEPAVRAVGAATITGPLAERELPKAVRTDPAPVVRQAAAEALAASGTVWGMEGAVEALADGDAGVRSAAAQAIARRGPEAVPFLQSALRADSPSAAGAVVTLSLLGSAGREVLTTTAASHPDEKIRVMAQLALGKAPGHGH